MQMSLDRSFFPASRKPWGRGAPKFPNIFFGFFVIFSLFFANKSGSLAQEEKPGYCPLDPRYFTLSFSLSSSCVCVYMPKYASLTDPLREFETLASPSTAGEEAHHERHLVANPQPPHLVIDVESTVSSRAPPTHVDGSGGMVT